MTDDELLHENLTKILTKIWEAAADRHGASAVLLAHPEVANLIGVVIGAAMLGAYELGRAVKDGGS